MISVYWHLLIDIHTYEMSEISEFKITWNTRTCSVKWLFLDVVSAPLHHNFFLWKSPAIFELTQCDHNSRREETGGCQMFYAWLFWKTSVSFLARIRFFKKGSQIDIGYIFKNKNKNWADLKHLDWFNIS